ncbi:unnamed protein product, partial [Iphiclides podalirius]
MQRLDYELKYTVRAEHYLLGLRAHVAMITRPAYQFEASVAQLLLRIELYARRNREAESAEILRLCNRLHCGDRRPLDGAGTAGAARETANSSVTISLAPRQLAPSMEPASLRTLESIGNP